MDEERFYLYQKVESGVQLQTSKTTHNNLKGLAHRQTQLNVTQLFELTTLRSF
jgi:hypothetical protein